MFDSLDEQIKRDQNRTSSSKQRMMLYLLYALAGAIVFGGLIFGVHALT
jgi:hypothetical protein